MTARRIQDAALRLFAEKGYDATTLADIAGAIGIKKPSIYAHYPGKMELFISIVDIIKSDYCICWQQALKESANLAPDERLKTLFYLVSRYFIDDREKMAFFVRLWVFPPTDCADEVLQTLQDMNNEFIVAVEKIFEEGIKANLFRPEPAHELSHAYFCLLDGYLMRALCYKKFDYHIALTTVWRSFYLGIVKTH